MKCYNSKKKLYLEVDVSQKPIRMALLQSVHEEHESDAECSAWVKTDKNDDPKTNIPSNLLPVTYVARLARTLILDVQILRENYWVW